ncbi:hypothetical protein [Spiroplasma endosymbiont of Danaus chrysippus]|uniref:hypothetical protein n=1 Tax=Spiroplasma endosymbiont of Danaus chrysippus TaxID=2691041 RepID=UPI00157B21A1|nr:hypothetical protein [Spiroplasma endosymbiont of Danaus chrysippus]
MGKGLYKSTDGITFEQLKSGLGKDDFIGSIAADETGVVYVGSSNYSGSKKTVYKSIDGINFSEISGTTGQIQSLITDSSNNVYAGTTNPSGSEGIIYKSNGTDEFHEIFKTVGAVQKLITDSSNNVYAGTTNHSGSEGIIYKSNGTDEFHEIFKTVGAVQKLITDSSNNVYAGTTNHSGSEGIIYKSNGTDEFHEIFKTVGAVQKLITDSSNNVYAGTTNPSGSEGIIYKSNGTDEFHEIFKTVGAVQKLITDSSNNVYAGTKVYNTKQGFVYKSIDGINFSEISGTTGVITSLAADNYNNIYAGTEKGLYKSNGTDEFTKVNEVPDDDVINSVLIAPNGVIYIGTENKGLYTINPINLLLKITKPDTFDKSWPLYQGIVYNSVQKMDIKENLVASATLDGKSITVPTTNLDIPVGEHNLILTLKDKALASAFGGDFNTGQVTYKLWVKTSIDKNKIDYQTKIDDTQLYTGLVSNAGNTNNAEIIQTKSKDGTGNHDASINIDFKDTLIDYKNSYFVQGTVDNSNDFAETATHQKFLKFLSIQNDGTYHLHLVDTVGNTYDSYLELGESNWKLKGTFDDSELDKLKTKLNVTVNLTDPSQKSKALGWLQQYDNFVKNKFNETIKTNGKGFDSEIKNQIISYISFLKPLTYDIANEPKFDDGFDKDLLVKTITDKAKEILNNVLNTLPKNLNVDTSNVVNQSTLNSYKNWINNYQTFINQNKDTWIKNIANIASRGFATDEQENKIKAQVSQFLNNDNIKNYLKSVVWEDNKLLKGTSNDYQQYIKLEKLKSETIDWVNTNMSQINTTYQQAIKNAESGLNLHGYSIDEILNGKSKPQTKNEINNFADGQSYHDWLQSQANIKFRGWQLAMGFGIAIPLLLVVAAVAWIIRSRTNPKYNGYWRGRKFDNDKKKENKLSMKKNMKKEN